VRDDVDVSAPGSAHVGRIAAGFHLELLDCVGGSAQILGTKRWVGVGGAIEKQVIRVWTSPTDNYSRALARTPVKRVSLAGLSAKTHVRARNGKHQVPTLASVVRKTSAASVTLAFCWMGPSLR
jgi:hypothetical protein